MSVYELDGRLLEGMDNVVHFLCFSFHVSVSPRMPPFKQPCMKSGYQKNAHNKTSPTP